MVGFVDMFILLIFVVGSIESDVICFIIVVMSVI